MQRLSEELCTKAFIGDIEGVKELIFKGANIHYRNDCPVRYAATKGHLEVIKYLISIGANIHSENEGGNILDNAVANGHLDVIKYLVSNGLKITKESINIANDYRFFDVELYLRNHFT